MSQVSDHQKTKPFHFVGNEELQQDLLNWYQNLVVEHPRNRAFLRRLEDPRDATWDPFFAKFETMLLKHKKNGGFAQRTREQFALIACLLAHAPGNAEPHFARVAAQQNVSVTRFQRLFVYIDPDDPNRVVQQFTLLRRLIKACGEPFNIPHFVQDLYEWCRDDNKTIQMRWSQQFFSNEA